jgi:mono/diheme cytochrome c family protein
MIHVLRTPLRSWPILCVLLVALQPGPLRASPQGNAGADGKTLYGANCAACHGSDGTGTPKSQLGYDPPPDFTDCSFATVEPDADWYAVAHDGGPARAFNRRMPAFGEALTEDQLSAILRYIRNFCRETAWPRGELNLPRPFLTEKAFPENETVFTGTITTGDEPAVGMQVLYEQRFGPRNQFEIAVPVEARDVDVRQGSGGQGSSGWQRGLGDVAVAVKRALAHSLDAGYIFSAAAELVFPTGKEDRGLGKGTTIVEPYLAFGKILPSDSFIQAQAGAEFPFNRDVASNEGFWRVTYGRTFTEGRLGFGRAWTPMVELAGAREFTSGESTHWDVVPQVQISLSRRQHILVNVGVQIPVNEREGRPTRILTYLLWDWFDGGLFEGWR